jgi:O-antigen ligase
VTDIEGLSLRGNAKFGPALRRTSGGSRLRLTELLGDTSRRFWIFAAFVALVFLMGGASREDVASLIVLRPAAALFAAYAFTVAGEGDFARIRVPLILLVALGAWMLIQLIPLPFGLWSALPGRAAIAEMDRLAGLGEIWRPLTLSPAKTMNALGALIVPVAGLMLFAVQSEAARRRVLPLFLIAASASALIGIGQIAAGGTGALYLYATTNLGDAVGLFSNRNHNAVFLATTLVICGYLVTEWQRIGRGTKSLAPLAIAAAALLVVATLLVNGSRAGLLIGMLALGAGVALCLNAIEFKRAGHTLPPSKRNWLPGVIVIVLALGGAVLLFSQSASYERLVQLRAADELRGQVLPEILRMAGDHWVLGTGFGSFEYVYRQYETSQWLRPEYLNNAHNDWLQWIIEGGAPAIAIALIGAVWLVQTARAHWLVRARNVARTRMVAMAMGVLLLLLLASALDYPLRVPSMMLYAIVMVALVADPPEPRAKYASRGGQGGDARTRLK